jgi:hypothetical protein
MYSKLINKIITILAIISFLGIQIIPAVSMAAEEINQNIATNEENVKFNATLNGTGSYTMEADLTQNPTIDFELKVEKTGYLKDIVVEAKDANYELLNDLEESQTAINSIKGNTINFNNIDAGNTTTASVKIKAIKEDVTKYENFDKTSSIVLKATYVNKDGNEKEIKKELKEQVKWNTKAEADLKLELLRYLKYENSRTMVSIKVSDGIKDNIIPASSKEITIDIPKLNGQAPTVVSATGKNATYKNENDKLIISKSNDNNSITWNSNEDFVANFIYETQSDDKSISVQASEKIKTIRNDEITVSKSENFSIESEVGHILEISTVTPSEINKGYMYTNINSAKEFTTNYEVSYRLNIGLQDLTNKIVLTEVSNELATDSDVLNNTAIKNKKIKVDSDEIKNTLGDEGKIIVKKSDGAEIAALTASNTELETDETKLVFETSQPVNPGNIEIKVEKQIAKTNLSRSQIKALTTINSKVNFKGYKDEKVVSEGNGTAKIKLSEPSSKATLDISQNTLSTIAKNEDVVFNVVLKTKDISDALYTDPRISIELPSKVNNIEIKKAEILYDNEITAGDSSVSGDTISVSLRGQQTDYSKSATTDGLLVRVETNIGLEEMATSSNDKVKLTYTNNATGETNLVEQDVKIVAPSEFVLSSTISNESKRETTIVKDITNFRVHANTNVQKLKFGGSVVSNLGKEATGFSIVGRIPFKGNKTLSGKDLGTTVDTKIIKAVEVSGLEEATVYYSENGEESVDGQGWTTELTANSKTYKIVSNKNVSDKAKIDFNYEVEIPANLDFEQSLNSIYGVYFNNDSTEGIKKDLVESKIVGARTEDKPALELEVKAYDETGSEINQNSENAEGKKITYKVNIKNTKSITIKNAKLNIELPDGLSFIGGDKSATYAEIPANSVKTVEIKTQVNELPANVDTDELKVKSTVSADDMEANATNEFTIKRVLGSLILQLKNQVSPNSTHPKGSVVTYSLEVKSPNSRKQTNVNVKLHLPQGTEYRGEDYEYDKGQNVVSIKYDEVGKSPKRMIVYVSVTEDYPTLTAYATATSDQTKGEIRTPDNTVNGNIAKKYITANQSVNIDENKVLDTDSIEFYVDIKNDKDEDVLIRIKDEFKDIVYLRDFTITGNVEVSSKNKSYINDEFVLNAKGTARVTIKCAIYSQQEGSQHSYDHKPMLTVDNEEIDINTITLKITGTGKTVAPENPDKPDVPIADGTFKISGRVWFDENNNGQQDVFEKAIGNLEVMLYDANTQAIAKDSKGNEVRLTTGADGKYTFTNLNKGKYNVIVKYDIEEYAPGPYRANKVADSDNNDFVQAKLSGEEVAGCDTITLKDVNVYNIDLGLSLRNTFDLRLDKRISKVTIVRAGSDTPTIYEYDNVELAKIELPNSNIEGITVIVEYKILVTNQGHVPGYAKSVVDYLPKGMGFSGEDNKDWYLSNGSVYTTSLANTIINPGETKELKLVLTRQMTNENTGIVRNTAEIASSYNELGIEDINSKTSNKMDGENDMSSGAIVLAVATGRTAIAITGITLAILAIAAIAVFETKKNVINKTYTNIL